MDSDYQEFEKVMAVFFVVYEKEPNPVLISTYFKILCEYPIKKIKTAADTIIRKNKFFPKPAEIIELIQEKTEDIAELEWVKVLKAIKRVGAYQSVFFDDPVTTMVIQDSFGGWIKLCAGLQEKDAKWSRRDFVQMYKIMSKGKIEQNRKLIGIHEDENARLGFADRIPAPVMIGDNHGPEIEYKQEVTGKELPVFIPKGIEEGG